MSVLKPVCGSKDVTVWQFDHYEIYSGKIFGIWPHTNWKNNITSLQELKNKWGFNYIVLQYSDGTTKFNNYINAGYNISNIMVTIYDFEHANHQWVIDTYSGAYAFYADEPNLTNEWRSYQLSFSGMPSYINQNSPDSYFITGSYKPTDGFDGYVDATNKVMFTSYTRWYEVLPGIWTDYWGLEPDQRWNWSYFKNRYGSKSQSNWIATHEDQDEYSDLLGKAVNLGFSEIWLYSLQNSSWDEISSYCYAGWERGWLRRFVRKYIYEYRCIYPNPCDCDPELPDGWYVYKVWQMNDIIEEFPYAQ